MTDDVLTLFLGWLGPHEAHHAAAVSKVWLSALAHAQWGVITLISKADPRHTSIQLTAMLNTQYIKDSLEVLRLRMVTAGSLLWHDPAERIPALQHCRRLRQLELTEVHITLSEDVLTRIATGCAASLEDVRIDHDMSIQAMGALLCFPKIRRVHTRTVHGRPLEAFPERLPYSAARHLESFRCCASAVPLEWLAFFTPPPSANLRDFELFGGSFSCELKESVHHIVDFLGALVAVAEDARRLRLPTLSCRLPPWGTMEASAARVAIGSYQFVKVSMDPSTGLCCLAALKEDDSLLATTIASIASIALDGDDGD